MKLVLVDNPGLAKLLAGMLDGTWRVEVYMGAVVDLPPDSLGIDVARDFRPSYVVRQPRIAKRLVKAISEAEMIYVATAPTCEADAAAWRLLKLANVPQDKPIARVTLRGLTQDAILAALGSAMPLDDRSIQAAETLRTAERLVGYLLTPLVRKALGATERIGYLTGIALAQIAAHKDEPPARWSMCTQFETEAGMSFTAELITHEGRRITFDEREKADKLRTMLRSAACWVAETATREVAHEPPRPHTLRSLVAAAPFPPARTLAMATTLYERAYITNPLLDEASLLPTGNPFALDGDINALYVLIAERARDTNALPTPRPLRAARIRAWWERDQSVWLTFRASDRDGTLPSLAELDNLRFIDAELVPMGTAQPMTEASLASDLHTRGVADLPTCIAAVAALVKSSYTLDVDGALRLSERGQALHGWIAAHCAELFAITHAIRSDRIAAGQSTRAEALSALWSRLQPVLAEATAPQPEHRPLVLHPLEA